MRTDRSTECFGCCGYPCAGPAIGAAGGATGATADAATGPSAPLKAALLLYTVPLALLFTGYAVGSALAFKLGIASAAPAIGAAVGAGVGLLLFFGSLGVLRLVLRGEGGREA